MVRSYSLHMDRHLWRYELARPDVVTREVTEDAGVGGPFSDDWIDILTDSNSGLSELSASEWDLREIPQYVLDYAPLVFLHSDEQYWPSDPAEHLQHVLPRLRKSQSPGDQILSLTNLSTLNKYEGGEAVFLSSKDDIQDLPLWIRSSHNIPVPYKHNIYDLVRQGNRSNGDNINEVAEREGWLSVGSKRAEKKRQEPKCAMNEGPIMAVGGDFQQSTSEGGYSPASAVLVVIEKENDVRDAFWFYFNSYNQGNKVLNIRFGNHVGDWEHSMVRFQGGNPKAIFTSRHSFGSSAYSYDAVEKIGKRPVVLPFNLLYDTTTRGPLWDPTILSLKSYTYDVTTDILRASNLSPQASTSWFYFRGRWGDKLYDLSDKRQYRFAGEYHYSTGPTGPRFKNLGRRLVCQNEKACAIRDSIR
ncbi:MAG: hypothetical protein LQ340_000926 [Diploschistes diacapsis]|nr:MAG: hypothetical protein LQ340_000926 [Diploschistes diacapsis]